MATWLDDILTAFSNLGGNAKYADLYAEIERIRSGPLAPNWDATVRERIERHSSDSEVGPPSGSPVDLFFKVGTGHWGIRTFSTRTPIAADTAEVTPPNRVHTDVYRIIRDTGLARAIKALHNHECQICGETITFPNGDRYSEAHHIKPLGAPHIGDDVAGNVLVLCPKHHVMCDYFAIHLNLTDLRLHPDHSVNAEYLHYHNEIADRGAPTNRRG